MNENPHNIHKSMKNEGMFTHPLFSYGFRPFFLLAALQAIISLFIWVYHLTYGSSLISWQNPALWHGHEMIFGFTMAIIAGFLLTAVPKWTNTKHVSGLPIFILSLVWLCGRLSMYNIFPEIISSIVDISFIPVLICTLAIPIIKAKKLKNIAFLGLLALLTIMNIIIHLQQLNLSEHGNNSLLISVFIVLQMIVIVGGRVIPMFTRNALINNGINVQNNPQKIINILSITSLPIILILGLMFGFDHSVVKIFSLLCAGVHLKRLSSWHGIKAHQIPIVWVLHLGYLWLVISLLLLTFEGLSIALHGFTAGVISTMILAMTTRVALGHTGRIINASKVTVTSYVLLQLSIITRIIAPFTDFYDELINTSGIFWVATFIFFLIAYSKILIQKSPSQGVS